MTARRPAILLACLAFLVPVAVSPAANALTDDEARALGVEAYVYGYPLVIMDVTRRVMTNVPKPQMGKAPVNQLLNFRAFPDDIATDVVSPNVDTLYTTAWLDLRKDPMVLSVPEMGKRYYLMQLLDAWTNVFASPGTRTTGNGKGDFAIVGPGFKGKLPAGVKAIKAPTATVWLIGRTQTNGKDDFAAVHAIQDQYRLTPLSEWGKPYTPPANVPVELGVDTESPPVRQVAALDAEAFFSRLNALMQDNPPAPADAPLLRRVAPLGIAPGKPFELKDMAAAVALPRSVALAQEKLEAEAKKPHGTLVNGWQILPSNTGNFGTDYDWRAVVAMIAIGANVPADAIYPHATTDAAGQPLTGANRYVMRFPKGQLPPVNAFWSVTMYNEKQLLVKNPIGRYALGDRDKLTFGEDGSLTIYIQHESPGAEKESNWLPAPQDAFNLFMRLYWPKKEILDGKWKVPGVERVGG